MRVAQLGGVRLAPGGRGADNAPVMPDRIEVEPGPTPPVLPGEVIVRATVDAVVDAIAADLLGQAVSCARAFGDFHLALSGGSTPEPLYRRLMYDPRLRSMPWSRTHLWIVDERRVPLDDERSNFKHIRELIVEHSDIPRSQVHPIHATADDAADAYERELQNELEWRERGHDRLDFVLLGVGADGHTASLFPRSPALHSGDRLVAPNSGPTVTPPDRVTMTWRLINASRLVAVMVTGRGKRGILTRLVHERPSPEDAPILGVRPIGGSLRWYIDSDACPTA